MCVYSTEQSPISEVPFCLE